MHVATQRGHAKRLQHRHSPRVQLVVPMREQHCRHARLPPRRCTVQALSRAQGQPGGAPGRQQQPQRLTMPRDALPTRLSSFCLLAMASPPRDTRRNPLLSQQTSGIVTGADSRYIVRKQYRLDVWHVPFRALGKQPHPQARDHHGYGHRSRWHHGRMRRAWVRATALAGPVGGAQRDVLPPTTARADIPHHSRVIE